MKMFHYIYDKNREMLRKNFKFFQVSTFFTIISVINCKLLQHKKTNNIVYSLLIYN